MEIQRQKIRLYLRLNPIEVKALITHSHRKQKRKQQITKGLLCEIGILDLAFGVYLVLGNWILKFYSTFCMSALQR